MLCCMQLQDFAEVTFQHLAPVCASARGDALLLLTRHADIFAGRLPRDPCTRVLLPLLARAADQGIASPHFFHFNKSKLRQIIYFGLFVAIGWLLGACAHVYLLGVSHAAVGAPTIAELPALAILAR